MDNILEPLAVGKLLRQENEQPAYRFFIPDYQRGYRWDDDQVTDLLDDFYEFIETSNSKKDKYCLQPVVVKKLDDGRYEVLDGQQRLTTIFILLSRLKKVNSEIDLFSLEYETRPDSSVFLKNIGESFNDENADYYYMGKAYITIDNWLKKIREKKINIANSLFDAIAGQIEFIWYEIKNEVDAIDVFTRINIGKIPLTNAELVKAVFLSKNNLSLGYAAADISDKDFNRILTLKQNAIALEWDQMEKALQDPKIWAFVYNGPIIYETRIDYLLDLISKKLPEEKNKYYSFKHFYNKVKAARIDEELSGKFAKNNSSFIESEWNNLKDVYDVLIEWYNVKKYNHLIGFLINQNTRISTIIDDFKNNNRDQFLIKIKSKIKTLIDCIDLTKLRYGSDNGKLDKILLFHNVYNSLLVKDNNIHFPFEKLKDKLWTLEHIFAQNSDELREDDYNLWLNDHLSFFKSQNDTESTAIAITIQNLLSTNRRKIEKEDFQDCFIKVAGYIQQQIKQIDESATESSSSGVEEDATTSDEYAWINEDHSIANLALLDGSINSAIKNSLFDIKRGLILEKDKQGSFVPNETKKVFLKYYTTIPKHLSYWTYSDRKAYIKSIKKTLTYLN